MGLSLWVLPVSIPQGPKSEMMKNKNILIAAALGVAAYLLLRKRTTQRPAYVPQQYYQAPPRGTAAFQNWANTILQVYGQSKWLFEPGGPFYNNKITDQKYLNDVLKQPVVDNPVNNYPTYPTQDDRGNWG